MNHHFADDRPVRQRTKSTRLHEQLEELILFDAVPDMNPEMLAGVEDPHTPDVGARTDLFESNSAVAGAEQSPAESQTELVFVDRRVDGYELLVADLLINRTAEVYFLQADSEGLEEIAAVLDGRNDIDAVHLISHGSESELQLGNAVLTAESMLHEHADELAVIRAALHEDADLLIYGCNFGAGQSGQAAVEQLARSTGADIAASDDLTGAAELGGDWDLEVRLGVIQTQVFQSSELGGFLMTPLNLEVINGSFEDPAFIGTGVNQAPEATVPGWSMTLSWEALNPPRSFLPTIRTFIHSASTCRRAWQKPFSFVRKSLRRCGRFRRPAFAAECRNMSCSRC